MLTTSMPSESECLKNMGASSSHRPMGHPARGIALSSALIYSFTVVFMGEKTGFSH
jgi:hypothetical protein